MSPENLYNSRIHDFETVETFAKRVYDTAKRYRKSLILNENESKEVVNRLAKYYNESTYDITLALRYVEQTKKSKKYVIQIVKCLGKYYLNIDKR